MAMDKSSARVIAVDLDGTLTLTDTLHESILALVRKDPFFLFVLLFWLLQGKAAFKEKVSSIVNLDVKNLPYNQPFLDWLKIQRSEGRKIALCTAANERIAHSVADHIQLFDHVIASDASNNMKSDKKRHVLEQRFGLQGYDYAGNDSADLEVWKGARQAIIVNASKSVEKKAAQISSVYRTFPRRKISLSLWPKAIRVHQWLKNLLLLVPLLAAHEIGNIGSLASLALAFIAFSLGASAVYITNDLIDLDSDRRHPRKRYRAFTSSSIPIKYGLFAVPVLVITSFAIGASVGTDFLSWLIAYFVMTSAYSLWLKRFALIDCLTLAALYTLRIIAGAAAAAISLSFWLLAFSVFIFLSLAFVKRYAELQVQADVGNSHAHGRGYAVSDAPIVQTLGITAGYAAVLVLALYLQGETVTMLYAQPELIWLVVPLMLFWVSWVWMKAHRGEMHDDPIVFAIKDRASLAVATLIAISFVSATKGLGG